MAYRTFMLMSVGCCACELVAHPHEWMNIIIEPIVNTDNEIIALAQTWLFDPLYAHILLESVLQATNNEAQRQGMKAIETEIMQKLTQSDYFTFSSTTFLDARNQSLFVEDDNLYCQFTLAVKNSHHDVSFDVYEPSYYVEMRYDEQTQQTQ